MKIRCRGFKRYKGVRRPACGCLRCWMKYVFNRKVRAKKIIVPLELPTADDIQIPF
jgi:hypothetical protein